VSVLYLQKSMSVVIHDYKTIGAYEPCIWDVVRQTLQLLPSAGHEMSVSGYLFHKAGSGGGVPPSGHDPVRSVPLTYLTSHILCASIEPQHHNTTRGYTALQRMPAAG
jgi:hypothetical protein